MAISIESEEVARLARRLADATGTSVDEAVAEALRVRLAAVDEEAAAAERRLTAMRAALVEIRKELATLPVLDPRPLEEMLYDEYGLPK